MFQMYSAGIQNATDAVEVAEVIRHAIETDEPELRYLVSWGAAEMVAGRDSMSAADWVGLGALDDDADYARRFSELMGVDITGV